MSHEPVHPTDLEPSLIENVTYATRRKIGRLDTATMLGIMIGLLTLIPARLIIPGTTDTGRPALVMCLAIFCWWVLVRLSPGLALVGPQPIRWAVVVYMLDNIVSYAIGYLRGLTTMEANSADRWMLATLAFTGVVLAVADGISNWARLMSLLRVFVWCAVVMAVLGLIQSIFAYDIVQYLVIPGLEIKGWVPDLQVRGASIRVASTATHYIELACVLATALPFAVHFARFSSTQKGRRRYLFAAIILFGAIFVTISRTGIAAVIITTFVLLPLWGWRMRYNVLVLGAMLSMAAVVAKPHLALAIMGMFTNAGTDPSITSRTQRYELVGYYFSQTPWFGRGTGTWVPPQYQYLDNQWLDQALTNGVVGVAVLAGLFLTALTLAVISLRRSTSIEDRHLCAVLVATQLIAIFSAITFDSLSFSTYWTVMALTIGMCGTVWRFTHPTRTVRTSSIHPIG